MNELIEGAIYRCADGDVRRLDKIEDDFLSYSLPIGKRTDQLVWLDVGRTHRHQIESDFVNGKQVSEESSL